MDIRSTKIRRGGGKQSHYHVYLPEEITEQILPKIPAKTLLRFRCVSKSWRSLIDKHLHDSKRRVTFKSFSAVDDLCWRIDDPDMKGGWVLGCCNGVLCVFNPQPQPQCFFLWNPAKKISRKLPRLGINLYSWKELRCGFGWDEESDAYKVFVCGHNKYGDGEILCLLYSSKTNSWKTVNCGRLHRCGTPAGCYNVGFFACGKLHWMSGSGRYVVWFDLKSEVFGVIELRRRGCRLRERGGCLYVVYNKKRRGEGPRWSGVGVVTLRGIGRERGRRVQECVYVENLV